MATRESGRPRGKKASSAKRSRRRATIAAALVSGKRITDLAREEGICRTYASQEANATETRLILADLLRAHHAQVVRLVGRSLDAVEAAFEAAKDADGKLIPKVPDHYARLAAAKRVFELLQLARPGDHSHEGGVVTWEAFLRLRTRILEGRG